MARRALGWTPVILLCAVLGCGDDNGSGPQPEQITGTWNATKVEYVSQPPGTTVDIVALGGSGVLTLDQPDAFQLVITPSGDLPDTTRGSWELDGDVMRVTPEGMPWSLEFDVAFSGDHLALTGASAEYDFDDDDTPEDATLNLAFVR